MITKEHFFTIPSSSDQDPRTANNQLISTSCNNHGPGFKATIKPLVRVFQ
jgi:hypothetical protein